MASIQQLLLNSNDAGSNEYKEGWNSAISFINDNYIVKDRKGEPITIVFEANINEKNLKNIIKESANVK